MWTKCCEKYEWWDRLSIVRVYQVYNKAYAGEVKKTISPFIDYNDEWGFSYLINKQCPNYI